LELFVQYDIFLLEVLMKTIMKRTVLITGGTGALGTVVARRFIRGGANIAVSYISRQELQRRSLIFKRNVYPVHANVTEETDVVALFRDVTRKFGRVDILINIVGGFLPSCELRNLKEDDWDRMMELNLKSVFLCAREFLKRLGNSSYGRIISMSAMPALKPSAGRAAYAVSKSGVIVLTQVLGEELKGTGITANAIAPSIIKTDANLRSMGKEDVSKWVTPEEIAETILFLCSDKARSINGACIPIFGGLS
jgi:NAD(P)-dependent dehydrogenase (short-subunit alcohol dehydrogenase family)